MIVDFSKENLKFHDWLYEIVMTVIYDKDYAYLAFSKAFSGLTERVFDGGTKVDGSVTVTGIKSEYDAKLSFIMSRRLNFIGLNTVMLNCEITDKSSGQCLETHQAEFELSTGEKIYNKG